MTTIGNQPVTPAAAGLVDERLVRTLRARIADGLARRRAEDQAAGRPPLGPGPDDERAYAMELLRQELDGHAQQLLETGLTLDPDIEQALVRAVRDALFGLGRLQALLDDEAIENIDANGSRVFLNDLVRLGALDEGLAAFLAAAVRARRNIVIAGETGAGKTTLLRALANEIPSDERLITVENAMELGLHEHKDLHPNVIALEARQANIEGEGEITMAQLVQRTLRHNPSRVIVGEVLGDEAVAMLEAMSQGNAGSLCTIHSPSAEFTFQRLAMYAGKSAQRLPVDVTYQMIEGAIDLVVFIHQHVERGHGNSDGQRRRVRHVSSVLEVLEADGRQIRSNQVFRPGLDGRAVPYTPPRCLDTLILEGYDAALFQQPTDWPGGRAP